MALELAKPVLLSLLHKRIEAFFFFFWLYHVHQQGSSLLQRHTRCQILLLPPQGFVEKKECYKDSGSELFQLSLQHDG